MPPEGVVWQQECKQHIKHKLQAGTGQTSRSPGSGGQGVASEDDRVHPWNGTQTKDQIILVTWDLPCIMAG